MARRQDLPLLRKIREVRQVQGQAAEARLAQAAAKLEGVETRRREAEVRLAGEQALWARSLAEPSLRLEMVRAWGGAVDAARSELDVMADRTVDAKAVKADAAGAWRLARARAEAAETLEGEAARRVRRAREEAALAVLEDRAAHKGGRR